MVVATYNRAAYLKECLESVRCQTFTSWECVVLDDGSTDGTKKYLSELAAFDNRFKVITREQNTGRVAENRDLAIRASSCEYIAFIDDDDRWIRDKLEVQLAMLTRHPDLAMCFGRAQWFGDQVRVWPTRPGKEGLVAHADLVKSNFVSCATVVLRRSVYDKLGGLRSECFPADDYDLWLRVVHDHTVWEMDRVLCEYRVHASNYSKKELLMSDKVIDIYNHHFEQGWISANQALNGQRRMLKIKAEHAIDLQSKIGFYLQALGTLARKRPQKAIDFSGESKATET